MVMTNWSYPLYRQYRGSNIPNRRQSFCCTRNKLPPSAHTWDHYDHCDDYDDGYDDFDDFDDYDDYDDYDDCNDCDDFLLHQK